MVHHTIIISIHSTDDLSLKPSNQLLLIIYQYLFDYFVVEIFLCLVLFFNIAIILQQHIIMEFTFPKIVWLLFLQYHPFIVVVIKILLNNSSKLISNSCQVHLYFKLMVDFLLPNRYFMTFKPYIEYPNHLVRYLQTIYTDDLLDFVAINSLLQQNVGYLGNIVISCLDVPNINQKSMYFLPQLVLIIIDSYFMLPSKRQL